MAIEPGNPEALTPDPPTIKPPSYEDVVTALIDHAQHDWSCRSTDDPHCPHSMTDDRVACAEYPCTCGLGAVLQALMPTLIYHYRIDEQP